MSLPKYFIVGKDSANPLFRQYINWLNNTYNQSWQGTMWNYYGYDGNDLPNLNGTNAFDKVGQFKNNPTILALEQWNEAVNGFVLPEKWCVRENKEVAHYAANKWQCQSGVSYSVKYYCEHDGTYHFYPLDVALKTGCIEITIEQFRQHVLKVSSIPEKWCVKPSNNQEEKLSVREYFTKFRSYSAGDEDSFYWHYPAYNSKDYCWTGKSHGYTEITYQEFQEHILKQTPMATQTITRQALKEIHDVVCDTWKAKIKAKLAEFPFDNEINISQEEINAGYKDASSISSIPP